MLSRLPKGYRTTSAVVFEALEHIGAHALLPATQHAAWPSLTVEHVAALRAVD